ncbi:hypothetical protein [Serratia ureilytica]|uniref:hypothetical protein n=1 Tax=Serratia marcescens TaxID=615 RepID=UPI00214E59F3|nr:hypothetical protein [Serratia ureilytica]UUW16198.1 hypothetical protein NAL25_13255 [Serratia ureilytica]
MVQLNRDTEHANDGSISPIFNKEKEQNRLKQAQLIGEIGGQTMDVIRTQGEIAGLKAQKDPAALAQAREQLEKSGKPTNDAAVMKQAYDNTMRQYGTGSDLQKAAQAVTGALTALAGNNLAGALFTAPRDLNGQLLWNQIKENPTVGKALPGMNNDPRFPISAGFQKMEAKQKLADGSTITVHYQFNSTTGKAYDMKITTPQRVQSDPREVINSIKDKVK